MNNLTTLEVIIGLGLMILGIGLRGVLYEWLKDIWRGRS